MEKIGPAEVTDAEEEATVEEAAATVGAEEAMVEEGEEAGVMDEEVDMEETDPLSATGAPFQSKRVRKSKLQ